MPAGPSSRARERERASTAAQAGADPPSRLAGIRPGTAVSVTITPAPRPLMCRTAAFAVMKWELVQKARGRVKASVASAVRGARWGRGARADGSERDVNTSRSLNHGVEVLLHGFLVESVIVLCLSGAAGSTDLREDGINLRRVTSRHEEPRPSRANARATAPPLARRPHGSRRSCLQAACSPSSSRMLAQTPAGARTERPVHPGTSRCPCR
jgi:hypothetical protein